MKKIDPLKFLLWVIAGYIILKAIPYIFIYMVLIWAWLTTR